MSTAKAVASLILVTTLSITSACSDTPIAPDATPPPSNELTGATQEAATAAITARARRRWVRRVRRATRAFTTLSVAQSAGYDVQATPCQESADGGMGYHFANFGLLDGQLDVTRPEILLYEPQRDGTERLVAVEYAIPYSEHARSEAPPQLHGVPFVHNDVFNLWVLHAWAWKRNPSGTFSSWNPRVSCQFDGR